MAKAYLYGKPCEILEYRAEGTVRVRMFDTGNVWEVPMRLVTIREEA